MKHYDLYFTTWPMTAPKTEIKESAQGAWCKWVDAAELEAEKDREIARLMGILAKSDHREYFERIAALEADIERLRKLETALRDDLQKGIELEVTQHQRIVKGERNEAITEGD